MRYKDKYPEYKDFVKHELFSFVKKGEIQKKGLNFVYPDETATEFMYFNRSTNLGEVFKSC
jgi:hypothetical protein